MFGGGGFAGDAGNQFAGGGFMPSQANDGGFGGGSGGRGNRTNTPQTLRALTIRQLAKDLANSDDDNFRVDGVELANVTVIGKILSAQDSNMRLNLVIADGTGELEVQHWLQDESDATASNKKAEWRPGTYIRCHGHIRSFERKRCLQAFSIRAVTNFNEMTYHFLRAIFEHLHLTKGGAAGGPAGGAQPMGMPAPAQGGGWQGGGAGPAAAMGGATTFAGAAGGDACQKAVLQLIAACNSDAGLHAQEIYNRLAGQFAQPAIQGALAALVNEALLYTTTDDDHFKVA